MQFRKETLEKNKNTSENKKINKNENKKEKETVMYITAAM